VKNRRNSHFVVLLSTVSHFDTLQTSFLIQLFRDRSYICAVIDWLDNWCSVEFIFKKAKRRADETNIVLP